MGWGTQHMHTRGCKYDIFGSKQTEILVKISFSSNDVVKLKVKLRFLVPSAGIAETKQT